MFLLLFSQGIYITFVYEGGPAYRAGLQVHDKILQVDCFGCYIIDIILIRDIQLMFLFDTISNLATVSGFYRKQLIIIIIIMPNL